MALLFNLRTPNIYCKRFLIYLSATNFAEFIKQKYKFLNSCSATV